MTRLLWFLLVAGLGIGLLVRSQLAPGADSADASRHYTDHLRHMGEAMVLTHQGFELYRKPYGPLVRHSGGLEEQHAVLFADRTAPYPPLGILVHWPWAQLERTGAIAPLTAHRGVVWMWTVVALGACVVVLRLFAPLPSIAQAWLGLLAVPLLVGMGVNGFFDCGYLLCGALACLLWRQQRRVPALWCLGLAAALHFRAAVFAPLAGVILWELRNDRRALGLGLASGLLVVPAALAAVALAGSLEAIPAHNPVHFSHLKPALALFTIGGLAFAVWLWREDERLVAATVVTAIALGILERSHGWWHAGTLLGPGLVLAARPHRVGWMWPGMIVWTVAASYLAFRHPASVFWQWVPFGLFGVG